MVDQDEFLIQELAEKTGVSQRTIRYYTQEGLLPEPDVRSKYAYYNQEHYDRLLLILQLKDSFLPLKEIRQLLVALSWPEVRDLLHNKGMTGRATREPSPPPARPQSAVERDSALDYINRLLNQRSEQGMPYPQTAEKTRPAPPQPDPPAQRPPTPPESWRRFVLAPGVELHIKEPSSSRDRQRIEDLIQLARSLFTRDPQ